MAIDLKDLIGKTYKVIDDNKVKRCYTIKSATKEKINPDSRNSLIRLTFTNSEYSWLFKVSDIEKYLSKYGEVREYITADGVGKNKRIVKQITKIY